MSEELRDCPIPHCTRELNHEGRHKDPYGSYFAAPTHAQALAVDLEVAMRGGYVAELPLDLIAQRLIDTGWVARASTVAELDVELLAEAIGLIADDATWRQQDVAEEEADWYNERYARRLAAEYARLAAARLPAEEETK